MFGELLENLANKVENTQWKLMTRFLTIFRIIPTTFPKLFRRLDERFRTFPKITEDCRRRLKKIRRCFDHTPTNLSVVKGTKAKMLSKMNQIFSLARDWSKNVTGYPRLVYTHSVSDLGVLNNLIGSLSLANEHYSPPTEWIMRKPNKNKMAGVNTWIERSIKSIFNGFLLKMLLRSLPVYILKQLFFSISVNSGRIFTEISKNNC